MKKGEWGTRKDRLDTLYLMIAGKCVDDDKSEAYRKEGQNLLLDLRRDGFSDEAPLSGFPAYDAILK